MHRIAVLAIPDVVAFDLAIPLQIFGHLAERRRYAVDVVSSAEIVTTTTGISLTRTSPLSTMKVADTIVVPGFVSGSLDPEVVESLAAAHARGTRMVSICTGAFALAEAGVLDGLRVTTHWHEAAELAVRYPQVTVDPDVLYVDNGRVLTGAGVAAGLDLCLHLYRLDHGADAAASVARRMVVAPYRDGGQAQYLDRPLPAQGTSLVATCVWALERLSEPLSVQALARHAGYAPRTFARRFLTETAMTPLAWITAQRVQLAQRLLETTDCGIDIVANRSGLGTAANLRLRFRREVGVTPSVYRVTFRGS